MPYGILKLVHHHMPAPELLSSVLWTTKVTEVTTVQHVRSRLKPVSPSHYCAISLRLVYARVVGTYMTTIGTGRHGTDTVTYYVVKPRSQNTSLTVIKATASPLPLKHVPSSKAFHSSVFDVACVALWNRYRYLCII
jgi:hypothetical protein